MKFLQFLKLTEQVETPLYFEELNESIDTKRQSLQKIQQMSGKKFVEFLEKLKPYIRNGKLNLDKLDVTEKIDGQAFRMAFHQGKVGVESAHSGLQFNKNKFDNVFGKTFAGTLDHLQKKMTPKLKEIADAHGDFKVIGELLYTDGVELDDDGTVTIVATKYHPKNLGKVATIVLFNEMVYQNGDFEVTGSDDIRKALSKASTKDIKFITTNDIAWKGKVGMKFNMSDATLKKALTKPTDLLKDRELLADIQAQFVDAFKDIIKDKGSVFGMDNSVVEGIVLNLPNFGMVGASNTDWKVLKNEIFRYETRLDDIKKRFFKSISGYFTKAKVLKAINDTPKDVKRKLKTAYPSMIRDLKQLERDFKKDKSGIPKSMLKGKDVAFSREFKNLPLIRDINMLSKYLQHKL